MGRGKKPVQDINAVPTQRRQHRYEKKIHKASNKKEYNGFGSFNQPNVLIALAVTVVLMAILFGGSSSTPGKESIPAGAKQSNNIGGLKDAIKRGQVGDGGVGSGANGGTGRVGHKRLRFKINDKVEANMGPDGYVPGKVAMLNVRVPKPSRKHFPPMPDHRAAYG